MCNQYNHDIDAIILVSMLKLMIFKTNICVYVVARCISKLKIKGNICLYIIIKFNTEINVNNINF